MIGKHELGILRVRDIRVGDLIFWENRWVNVLESCADMNIGSWKLMILVKVRRDMSDVKYAIVADNGLLCLVGRVVDVGGEGEILE